MFKVARDIVLWFFVAIAALLLISKFMTLSEPEKLNYDQFLKRAEAGKIITAVINNGDGSIEGKQRADNKDYRTEGPVNHPELYVDQLRAKGVKVSFTNSGNNWWAIILPNLSFFILFLVFWFFLINQMQNSGNKALSFGKSKARLHSEDKSKVTFDDVAGEDEAKAELVEIVEFLRQPRRFTELGAKIPKGVLLIGHPGTGKTLLAKAVAGEAGVPFFSISGSDFVEMFVGVGASRVRDLFEQAKKNSPCIVFIDEIDAVGRQRGAGLGGGHDEREQTLNQLLVEMDGFEPNSGIIIVAATNRPDVLDPALLRPGRFDRHVTLDIPDIKGREDILRVHAKGKPLSSDVDLKVLARRTPGFTGADLANMLNEAALLAARRNKKRIENEDCEEAIERVIAGPEKKSRIMNQKERELTAYHEAGHALVGHYLPTVDPIHKISIIPRGQAGGYTLALPLEDKHYQTRTELLEDIVMFLGGRAAEVIALGEISTGARSDLERATRMVRKMITEYGMSDNLGYMTFGHGHEDQVFLGRDIARDKNYSEEIAAAIDREIRRIMDDSFKRATDLIVENRDQLNAIAQMLLEKETIEAHDFVALIGEKPGQAHDEEVSPDESGENS
ncbi:MAG TPA: ATP-dependent zinc metalloprotease FtsH [Bacillota bacterium]|nr:ATP-dependent zinc metalloprotease FtsH [Bacillota bacterium]